MDALAFLRAVWPDEGLYCIAVPLSTKGYEHHVFETIEAAAEYVEKVRDEKNVFFGTHTLKEARLWDPHHHRDKTQDEHPWVGGWRVRTQVNSRSSRVFFFDLDVEADNDKKYPTQAAAVAGLQSFVAECRLPVPMVVSSGGGLHVYWCLVGEMESAEWVILAGRFKQLAHHHGLKIDNTRTTDTASVLRVAGTFNHKGNTAIPGTHAKGVAAKRPVVVYKETTPIELAELKKLVNVAIEDADVTVLDAKGKPKAAKSGAAAKLGTNTAQVFDGPQPTMVALLTACAQIRRIAEVCGATSDEPEWYATAGAVKFVADGRKFFHRISSGHKDYDAGTCDDKFDQWQAGPVSCSKMEDACGAANAHLCHSCPFITKGKYPTSAARLLDTAPAPKAVEVVAGIIVEREIPNPPMPWKRSRDGGIVMLTENDKGQTYQRKIASYDLYPLERSANTGRETETQAWRAHLPHGETRDIAIEAAVFVDDKQLMTRLANNGIYSSNFGELKSFMSAYIQELQRLAPTTVQHNHLGWVDEHSRFVLPTKILHEDGTESPAQLAKVASTAKTYILQKGSLQRQVELMRFYKDPRYVAQQMFILASLASPLFFMTGHSGVVIHAQGESGGSKSSSLYTAASFWGNPKKYVINCTAKGATEMYRATRLGVLNNLPCCLDEITGMQADIAKDFAMGSTQSAGRGRSDRDGTPKESITGDERASVIMSNANVSLQALLTINNTAGIAGAARVFEIRFEKDLGVHKPMEADNYLREMFENYGWIGENFMRLVVAKREKVKAAILKVQDELAAEADMKSHERFWFAAAATALVAGDIAQKLGYLDYDLVELRRWFLAVQLPEMRGTIASQRDANSPLATLTDYLAHIHGNILKTKKIQNSLHPNILTQLRGQLVAHHHIDQGVIHILKQDFRDYCNRAGRYSQEVLKALTAAGIVVAMDRRIELGQGTDLAMGRAWCFTVNLLHPELTAALPKK